MRSHVTITHLTSNSIPLEFQYRKRYEITCDSRSLADWLNDELVSIPQAVWDHMWRPSSGRSRTTLRTFQYRKRYEITCDLMMLNPSVRDVKFQYRKRYEITCDAKVNWDRAFLSRVSIPQAVWDHMWRGRSRAARLPPRCFNTASGMRSHVTHEVELRLIGDAVSIPQAVWDHMWLEDERDEEHAVLVSIPQAVWDHMWPSKNGCICHVMLSFQYRKRYEITCDNALRKCKVGDVFVSIPQAVWDHMWLCRVWPSLFRLRRFQYRKRYEITCDDDTLARVYVTGPVSIPQAVWDHMWHQCDVLHKVHLRHVSIPQAVWDHMWPRSVVPYAVWLKTSFNTASGMRSHVTRRIDSAESDFAKFQYRKRYEITCD